MKTIALAGLAEAVMVYYLGLSFLALMVISIPTMLSFRKRKKVMLAIALILFGSYLAFFRPWMLFKEMNPVVGIDEITGEELIDADITGWNKTLKKHGFFVLSYSISFATAIGISMLRKQIRTTPSSESPSSIRTG